MDEWFKDILPDKDPYHNRGRDQMRKKGGPDFKCLCSLHGKTHTISINMAVALTKSDGLKSLSFLISPVRNVSGLILYMYEVESI